MDYQIFSNRSFTLRVRSFGLYLAMCFSACFCILLYVLYYLTPTCNQAILFYGFKKIKLTYLHPCEGVGVSVMMSRGCYE